MLEIKSVYKSYGEKRALNDVSFSVPDGQVWSLLGVNGAGKSTLFKIICNLVFADSGNVTFNGKAVAPQNGNLGYMIESPSFLGNLTGKQNLKALSFLYDDIGDKRINEVLSIVGLKTHCNDLFKDYSTGMKQRLYFAYAILNHPKLLILDEPFNGMDPVGISYMQKLIRSLTDDGFTVLVSGHNIAELQEISDGAVIVDHGKIISVLPDVSNINLTEVFLKTVTTDGEAQ